MTCPVAPTRAFRVLSAACVTATALYLFTAPAAAQSVPGFTVSPYASVIDPIRLARGLNGELFVGRDPNPAGSITPFKVWRVAAGGSPVVEMGNTAISDPDVVALDVDGTISGTPGSLLVAGLISTTVGRISAIKPDGSVVTLFESNQWANIAAMSFDHAGRLVFIAVESDSIWVTTGRTPVVLVDLPGNADPLWMTIAADDSIYVSDAAGTVRIYASDGTLLNPLLVDFPSPVALSIAPGGPFGTDLHALERSSGKLFRVNAQGVATQIGQGFGSGIAVSDILFGPCGELYVAMNPTDQILVVNGPTCACGVVAGADLNGDGVVNAADLAALLGAWGTNNCSADLNGDGTVNAADLSILLGAWG